MKERYKKTVVSGIVFFFIVGMLGFLSAESASGFCIARGFVFNGSGLALGPGVMPETATVAAGCSGLGSATIATSATGAYQILLGGFGDDCSDCSADLIINASNASLSQFGEVIVSSPTGGVQEHNITLMSSAMPPPGICGNCDLLGPVNIIDVLAASQISVGTISPNPTQQILCDVDGVPGITTLDALMIAQFIVGLQPSLTC